MKFAPFPKTSVLLLLDFFIFYIFKIHILYYKNAKSYYVTFPFSFKIDSLSMGTNISDN